MNRIVFLLGITWFRQRLLLLLKEIFSLDIRYIVATLLHPRYRSLKKFPDHVKVQCHKYVRIQISQLRAKAELDVQLQSKLAEPPVKKLKKIITIYSVDLNRRNLMTNQERIMRVILEVVNSNTI